MNKENIGKQQHHNTAKTTILTKNINAANITANNKLHHINTNNSANINKYHNNVAY